MFEWSASNVCTGGNRATFACLIMPTIINTARCTANTKIIKNKLKQPRYSNADV